ncbi:MAG: Mur ligase family protein [Roseobacter sp.]
MSLLWGIDELARVTGGRWISAPDETWAPNRVSYDVTGKMTGHICVLVHKSTWGKHRRDPTGDIPRLAKHKAAALIVQHHHLDALARSGEAFPESVPVLLVESTWAALRKMAVAARDRFGGKVFALTGTVGKTTTRELIRHLTSFQGGAESSRGNNNNISGVFRTVAYTPRDLAATVVEMGFGKPFNGIERSSIVARPDVAILTGIDVAHFDMFTDEMLAGASGQELLCQHKSCIFKGLTDDGAAVINADMAQYEQARKVAEANTKRVFCFGESDFADARIISLELFADRSHLSCELFGAEHQFTIGLPGRHMALNALCALLAVTAAGFDVDQAVRDIESFQAVRGRARCVAAVIDGNKKIHVIDDSFNATLASMRSTIDLLDLAEPDPGGRRIAVIGEIAHVGRNEAEEHRKLAAHVTGSKTDLVFSWGPLMKAMYESLPATMRGGHQDVSVEALYGQIRPVLQDGDVITLKSGRGVNGLGDIKFRKFVSHLLEGAPELKL